MASEEEEFSVQALRRELNLPPYVYIKKDCMTCGRAFDATHEKWGERLKQIRWICDACNYRGNNVPE